MDSTNLLNQIAVNQAEKEVTANENFAAASPAMLYARNAVTSLGLTWGFTGGRYLGTAVASGTIALTLSVTNYVVANITTGAVTAATTTTNWNNTTGFIRLYLIVAGASTVTSYEDHRQSVATGSGLAYDTLGNIAVGIAALATTATNGFLYIPTCAGTPTGTPTTKTGLAPMIVDSTALKFWVYVGGAWKSAQLV